MENNQKWGSVRYLLLFLPVTSVLVAMVVTFLSLPEITAVAAQEKSAAQQVEEKAKGDFEDGIHHGVGTGFAGKIEVDVKVANKSIESVNITRVEADDASYVSRAKMGVIAQIISKQKWAVDAVSGATYSSRGIMEAVQNALTGVSSNSTTAAAASGASASGSAVIQAAAESGSYRDGTYQGSAQGYAGAITVGVTISGGKIAGIEILSNTETPSYFEQAVSIIGRIIAGQSTNVDTVSGATYSANGIVLAVRDALSKAAQGTVVEGTMTPVVDPLPTAKPPITVKPAEPDTLKPVTGEDGKTRYQDGYYTAKAAGYGGADSITVGVTIEKNLIQSVKIVDWKDTKEYQKMTEGLLTAIYNAQGIEAVDVVSGATYSSKGILDAAKAALEKAQIKKGENPVDKTTLEESLTLVKTIKTEPYTKESAANLEAAIAEGEAMLQEASATQEDVNTAIEKLRKAVADLKVKEDPASAVDEKDPVEG